MLVSDQLNNALGQDGHLCQRGLRAVAGLVTYKDGILAEVFFGRKWNFRQFISCTKDGGDLLPDAVGVENAPARSLRTRTILIRRSLLAH